MSAEAFVQIIARDAQVRLRIGIVHDMPYHYDGFEKASFCGRVDNWRNILSNKISWTEVVREARQKDLWIEPIEICRVIDGYPLEPLKSVRWARCFDMDRCKIAFEALRHDILYGRDDSLANVGKGFLAGEVEG